ncbi:MAG: hypothetical protein OEL75_03335, partial [Kiritimatiellaceae bacterium]|nr:hypothetical protein [Kiritimatiellaceae bacterium]
AVQFDDADIVLKDQTNIADCVEIYARGDTGSQPEDYFSTQSSAQCYTFGMAKNRIDQKIKLGNLTKLPIHVPVKGSVKLEGNHFIYEIMVPLFDTFNPATRRKSSESEVYVGDDIGIDIAIIDVGKNGYAGMLGENDQDKRISASHIAEHTLDD